VFNALRSPYFDFGLTGRISIIWSWSARKGRIVSGREQWEEAWEMLSNCPPGSDETLDDERRERNPLRDVDLPALQNQFSRFWQLFDGIAENRSQTGWVAWLEALLAKLGFYEQLSGERDLEAWQTLGETLGALVLSEQVLGEREVDYARFLSDLVGAVQGAQLDEPREARNNACLGQRDSSMRPPPALRRWRCWASPKGSSRSWNTPIPSSMRHPGRPGAGPAIGARAGQHLLPGLHPG
jgi:hypothetical protein